VEAQSQLGGFAHPGMALVLFALLTASNEAHRSAAGEPPSIYASATHDPARSAVGPAPSPRPATPER
jgi:hypothetical protein